MAETEAIAGTLRGFDSVFFDCDSTLSTVEGIDELARMKGRSEEIAALTEAAMAGEVPLESVYGRRLSLLMPTESEVTALAELYQDNVVGDARAVVRALVAAGKNVFIVSGGFLCAVRRFGEWLGVPADNIRAVPVGQAAESPLARSDGKPLIIGQLLQDRPGRSVLVGDGASDLEARGVVDLFVGYTGVVERRRVVDESDVLITGESLAPVLGLALTEAEESALLASEHATVVSESRARIEAGELAVKRGSNP
ncbi:MAG: HAD-IB family phosphatase [Actinomycetota bacterium]